MPGCVAIQLDPRTQHRGECDPLQRCGFPQPAIPNHSAWNDGSTTRSSRRPPSHTHTHTHTHTQLIQKNTTGPRTEPPQHVLRPERTTQSTQQRQKNNTSSHSHCLAQCLSYVSSPPCCVAPARNAVQRAPLCPRRSEENIVASPIPRVHSDTSRAWHGDVSPKHFGNITAMSRAVRVRRVTSLHQTNPV